MSQHYIEKNPKVRATSTIWGCAIGMLGVCIPLVVVTESGILLPLLVALSAASGTAAVWISPDKRQQEETHLVQKLKGLEERIIDLETIYVSLPDSEKPFVLADTPSNLKSE